MPTAVVLPKQGQSVESCIISAWKKKAGETVETGEILCEVETDKALVEIESPASGVLLEIFFKSGDDVPVLTNIAAVGQPGEDVNALRPAGASVAPAVVSPSVPASLPTPAQPLPAAVKPAAEFAGVSPRARNLAKTAGLDPASLSGSGPAGRIIERDVQAALTAQHTPTMTPLARTMLATGDYSVPVQGSGVGGRIRSDDL